MAKKILNMSLFQDNLNMVLIPLEDAQIKHSNGLSNVVKYVWNHYPTSSVDFNSFKLEDVYEAKSYMYGIPSTEQEHEQDENDENDEPVFNPWIENYIVENAISALYHSEKIVYENDDDFI